MPTDAWNDIYSDQKQAERKDLVLENRYMADAGGAITTDWYLTDDVLKVRVLARFLGGSSQSLTIEEGMWYRGDSGTGAPMVLKSTSLTVTSSRVDHEMSLGARAFRIVANGAGNENYLYVTVRKVA